MAPPSPATNGAAPIQGPHPSFIQVAKQFVFEQKLQECMAAIGVTEAKEDNIRLQGVTWIDNVRRALQLPVRTYDTAVIYYHKFRLVHPDHEYDYRDAAAAALFNACKIEDTLKKSREILCAAWNLKLPASEHLSSDDSFFDDHAKKILGLERLNLEASGFDFRNRYPQRLLIKLVKSCGFDKDTVGTLAYNICLDLYRTFAPLKQSTQTMAMACIELAARLYPEDLESITGDNGFDYKRWATTRPEIMETLVDLLDLYTHHRVATLVGPDYTLDTFIAIRITLNQEASLNNIPRYTYWNDDIKIKTPANDPYPKPAPSTKAANGTTSTTTSPKSPARNGTSVIERPKDGTIRFMLDPGRARDEKMAVRDFFKVEEVEEVLSIYADKASSNEETPYSPSPVTRRPYRHSLSTNSSSRLEVGRNAIAKEDRMQWESPTSKRTRRLPKGARHLHEEENFAMYGDRFESSLDDSARASSTKERQPRAKEKAMSTRATRDKSPAVRHNLQRRTTSSLRDRQFSVDLGQAPKHESRIKSDGRRKYFDDEYSLDPRIRLKQQRHSNVQSSDIEPATKTSTVANPANADPESFRIPNRVQHGAPKADKYHGSVPLYANVDSDLMSPERRSRLKSKKVFMGDHPTSYIPEPRARGSSTKRHAVSKSASAQNNQTLDTASQASDKDSILSELQEQPDRGLSGPPTRTTADAATNAPSLVSRVLISPAQPGTSRNSRGDPSNGSNDRPSPTDGGSRESSGRFARKRRNKREGGGFKAPASGANITIVGMRTRK